MNSCKPDYPKESTRRLTGVQSQYARNIIRDIMYFRTIFLSVIFVVLLSLHGSATIVNDSSYIPSELSKTCDLAITGSITPVTAEMDSPFTASIQLINYGPGVAKDIQIDYYLKKFNESEEKPVWIHQKTATEIPAFYQDLVTFSVPLPGGIEPGKYSLYSTIQTSSPDRNTSNNIYTSILPIDIRKAYSSSVSGLSDLRVTIDDVSSGVTAPGYPLTINYTVSNAGDIDSGTFHVGFFFSKDSRIEASDLKLWDEIYYHAYPGMTEPGSSTDIIPDTIPPGDYYLGAIIDFTHMVRETDDQDNFILYPGQIHLADMHAPVDEQFLGEVSGYIAVKTNLYRQYRNLPNLTYDLALGDIAISHSLDMAERGYFAHETPEGIDPTARADREQYPTTRRLSDGSIRTGIAENIIKISSGYTIGKQFSGFVDPSNPQEVADVMMIEWISSPEHNKNLINPDIEKTGVGVAYDGEFFYATQNFY